MSLSVWRRASARVTLGSNSISACSCVKLTATLSTPGRLPSAFSIVPVHNEQCSPPIRARIRRRPASLEGSSLQKRSADSTVIAVAVDISNSSLSITFFPGHYLDLNEGFGTRSLAPQVPDRGSHEERNPGVHDGRYSPDDAAGHHGGGTCKTCDERSQAPMTSRRPGDTAHADSEKGQDKGRLHPCVEEEAEPKRRERAGVCGDANRARCAWEKWQHN